MKMNNRDALSLFIYLLNCFQRNDPPIHLSLTSSTLIEATEENNAMDDDEQKNYNPMDEDEASDGLPHP